MVPTWVSGALPAMCRVVSQIWLYKSNTGTVAGIRGQVEKRSGVTQHCATGIRIAQALDGGQGEGEP